MVGVISVTDFVVVRFCTKPYSFMRIGHRSIIPWLDAKKIIYVAARANVCFELPEELEQYTVITYQLCQQLAPVATEVKRRLAALVWTKMYKRHVKLSRLELDNLMNIGVPLIL